MFVLLNSVINNCRMNFDNALSQKVSIDRCEFSDLNLCMERLENIEMTDTIITKEQIAKGNFGIHAKAGTISIKPTDESGTLTITETGIVVTGDENKNLARLFGLWIVDMLTMNESRWIKFTIADKPVLEIENFKVTTHIELDENTKEFFEKVESVIKLSLLR